MVLRTAVKYGLKAWDVYYKHGKDITAAYNGAKAGYMAGKKYAGRKRRGSTKNSKAATKRQKVNHTWGDSSSAFKKERGRARQRRPIVVDGTAVSNKTIAYKKTKLGKTASYIGGEFVQQTQAFVTQAQTGITENNSQFPLYLTTVYESADVLNIFNQAYQNIPTTAPIDGAAPGPIVVNTSSSYKFMLNSVCLDINGTNMSAGGATMTLYTIMTKNSKTSTAHPYNDWNAGIDDASGILGAAMVNATRIGSKPTESKLFNMNFKIVDKKTYEVGPGGKIHHTFNFKPNSLVDTEYWARNNFVRGFTMWVLAVGYGQLGTIVGGAAIGQPAIKPINFVWNIVKTYKSKAVQHFPRSRIEYYQNFGVTNDTLGAIQVREDDGELET